MKENKNITIAIDFDGTLVTHEYPLIGKDIGAFSVLRELQNKGHKLVLNTMRGDDALMKAVRLVESKGIKLYGVNRNPEQTWTTSPKVLADLYIDDAALGIPLITPVNSNTRPYVDWLKVRSMLVNLGLI